MPEPGSHKFDVRHTRPRGHYERDNPPHRLPPRNRAAGPTGRARRPDSVSADEIRLRSPAFNDHDFLPERYARVGEDIAPPLEWSDVPDGTQELALLCEDLDAPGGSFAHWVVTGIPPDTHAVGDALPRQARVGRNGFGEAGWGGPLPPTGDDPHRYAFRLIALDTHLDLPDVPQADDVRAAVRDHGIGAGTLVGLYAR